MDQLQDIVNRYDQCFEQANQDLTSFPPATRAGHEAQKNRAKDLLKGLAKEVLDVVIPNHLVGIFLDGDPAGVAEVAQFLHGNGGIHLEADALYRHAVDLITPSMGKDKTYRPTQHNLLVSSLRDQLGGLVEEIPAPVFEPKQIESPQDLLDFVRRIIRDAMGDMPLHLTVRTKIGAHVLKAGYTATKIPVVVTSWSDIDRQSLSSLFSQTRTRTVPEGQEITKTAIGKLFK